VKRLATPLLAAAILAGNLWLNGPLFMEGELPFRGSIEGGYAAMARFVAGHPNPWGWNPLQYCGLPTQFLYLPGLPYLTALAVHIVPHASPAYVYRVIASFVACLGPVIVFFFALRFTGSRRWALAAALAYEFFSPSYGLFPAVEKDRGIVQLPWRMQVLAKYGEGPHNVGLALLPLALWAVWRAGVKRGYPSILVAALALAAIPLTNWVSALALAISCLLLLVAAIGEREFRWWRCLAAAALAYGLACFWLTPSFIGAIVSNWPADSFGYQFGARQALLVAGLAAGVLLIRAGLYYARASFYFSLTILGAFTFGWIATMFYVYAIDTLPESRRYALEFELFLLLAIVEGLRLTLRSSNQTVRMCAIGTAGALLLAGAPQLWAYATQGWQRWKPAPKESTVEYRLAKWIDDHGAAGRVFASGGLRFRLNSWMDVAQIGGGFETGLRNRMPVDLAYHIRTGRDMRLGRESEDTLLELKALGAQYVVVHGAKSQEYYRDFARPERLAGVLPAVYHDGDDTIYALPPRPLAHLTAPEELPDKDAPARPWVLEPYVAAIEDAGRPALRTQWMSSEVLAIDGPVPAGRLVAVQVNNDPGWRATQDGRPIEISQDRLGFVVLHPTAAATTRIELRYRGTAEQRIMAAVSALTWVAALAGLWVSLRRK
jgi:hypothetical protein